MCILNLEQENLYKENRLGLNLFPFDCIQDFSMKFHYYEYINQLNKNNKNSYKTYSNRAIMRVIMDKQTKYYHF